MGTPPDAGPVRKPLMTQRRILGRYGGEVQGQPRGGLPTLLRGLMQASECGWPERFDRFFTERLRQHLGLLWATHKHLRPSR